MRVRTNGAEQHQLEIVQDHILLALGNGRALIDTGSPMSIGRGRSFDLDGRTWQPSTANESVLDAVREHLNIDVEWLVGYDVLSAHRMLLNWRERSAWIGALRLIDAENEIPIEFAMNVPVISASYQGNTVRAVLDSGAALSYAPPRAIAGAPSAQPYRDFYPGVGAFETETWRVPVRVGEREIQASVGVLPDALQMLFGLLLGPDGWIMGSDFFSDRAILIDYAGRRVVDVTD